jgi:hypothetical protein
VWLDKIRLIIRKNQDAKREKEMTAREERLWEKCVVE